ncbi:MAG: glutaredoxin [Bacteriovoracaceae bacterium]|jgi:glutaredoxin
MIKFIRLIVGTILKVLDKLTSPSPNKIDDQQKAEIIEKSKGLELYEFSACPFCIKVKRFMRKNNISTPLRDAKNDASFKKELLDNGGRVKVPCLKITKENNTQWLYESNDIIEYFQKNVLT